jgi:hypothetical protein
MLLDWEGRRIEPHGRLNSTFLYASDGESTILSHVGGWNAAVNFGATFLSVCRTRFDKFGGSARKRLDCSPFSRDIKVNGFLRTDRTLVAVSTLVTRPPDKYLPSIYML